MLTTTHMGLQVWNLLTDAYNHEQLANNWAKVDLHDHSPGRGVLIPTEGINPGAITEELLAENSVGPKQIQAAHTVAKYSELPVAEKRGRIYEVTEGVEKGLWWDTGAAWLYVAPRALVAATHSSNFELKNEELGECTAGLTATAPTPTADSIFTLLNVSTGEVKLKAHSGEKFAGVYGTLASEVAILEYQSVTFQADGTNWLLIAGEPKRTATYAAVTKSGGEEHLASSTRPALVTVTTNEGEATKITVNAAIITELAVNTAITFFVPPGVKWGTTNTVKYTYILL